MAQSWIAHGCNELINGLMETKTGTQRCVNHIPHYTEPSFSGVNGAYTWYTFASQPSLAPTIVSPQGTPSFKKLKTDRPASGPNQPAPRLDSQLPQSSLGGIISAPTLNPKGLLLPQMNPGPLQGLSRTWREIQSLNFP